MVDECGGPEIAGTESDYVVLRVGQSVGRYLIGPVLGQGGFGITYRATDSQLGRDVAIKEYLPAALAVRQDGITVLPRSKSAADDFAWGRDRFVAEGRTLAALHHAPGIVRVHDFLEANGTAYIVMELLGGETLHKRLAAQGTLDAAAVDRIARPLLDGLEQVHGAGFLHRDIKPANILLDSEGRPTLIDFGASRVAVAGRSQAMTAVFTPGYAAVEQFTSATQGPWTDIYGLAATLHHAVTGLAPPNSIDRMLDDTYVPLAGKIEHYPPGLLAGIDAGLAVRAAERPQSIAAWREILLRAGVSGGAAAATVVIRTPGTAVPSAARPAVPARRRLPVLITGSAALAAVVLGGAYMALSPARMPAGPVAVASSPPSPTLPSTQDLAAQRAREELEQARREQQKAADEIARLRAEAEARRKADEEAALRRKIEAELRQKAETEEAARRQAEQEAKQKADADAAAQLKAEQEEKQRADAEAAARVRFVEDDKKAAELAETGLHLNQTDRQRLQVALTSLGFATGGSDGAFGPRTREAVASWQRQSGRAATGYFTADTRATLLREATVALARHDEEQKKIEDAGKAPPASTAQAPGPAAIGKGAQCEGVFRSQWCRDAYQGFPGNCWQATMTIKGGAVSDGWASTADRSKRNVITGTIDGQGVVRLNYTGWGSQTHINQSFVAQMSGTVANGVLTASGQAGAEGRRFSVRVACR
jgi:hypothetical protein